MTDPEAKLVQGRMRQIAEQAGGHPPSDGAHRLGWWIAGSVDPVRAAAHVAHSAGLALETIERLLSGEVEPEDFVREAIADATQGVVMPADWRRGGPLGWLAPPWQRAA